MRHGIGEMAYREREYKVQVKRNQPWVPATVFFLCFASTHHLTFAMLVQVTQTITHTRTHKQLAMTLSLDDTNTPS